VKSLRDCDGDGILDHYCMQYTPGNRWTGFISSRDRCRNSFPLGGCGGSCWRPQGWCEGPGQLFSDERDYDGDGIPDPACLDQGKGSYISSAHSCQSTRRVGGACLVPPRWCSDLESFYSEVDCDFDGIPDAHCQSGSSSGFISSAYACAESYPLGGCREFLGAERALSQKMQCTPYGRMCDREPLWCDAKNVNASHSRSDVDGDSLVDHVCHLRTVVPGLSNCGAMPSSFRCLSTVPNCYRGSNMRMELLVSAKDLVCNLWTPFEIFLSVFSVSGFLYAYGACGPPPACRWCRSHKAR